MSAGHRRGQLPLLVVLAAVPVVARCAFREPDQPVCGQGPHLREVCVVREVVRRPMPSLAPVMTTVLDDTGSLLREVSVTGPGP